MSNRIPCAVALWLCAILGAPAFAQTPDAPGAQAPDAQQTTRPPRFFISANGGYQFGSQDIETSTQFEAFEEQATITSAGKLQSEPIFDVGGAYRLTDTLGVGVAYSLYVTESDVAVTAEIPHPVFFDQVRIATYGAAGVKHTSSGLHLQGVWFVPFTTKIDFIVSAGPSIVFVKQDVVSAANLLPEEPPFNEPRIDTIQVSAETAAAFGFNAGADAIYAITPRYGLGINLRYVFAKADVDGLSDSVTVGGFQVLAGLRVKLSTPKFW